MKSSHTEEEKRKYVAMLGSMSLAQVAEQAGVHRQTVAYWKKTADKPKRPVGRPRKEASEAPAEPAPKKKIARKRVAEKEAKPEIDPRQLPIDPAF